MPELIIPGNHDNLMWGLDLKGTRKNWAWFWWWWLLMFKDKGSKTPRQLMVLWSGKTADSVKVRDYEWKKKYDPVTKKGKTKFSGLVCSWFYDGHQMHDPLFIVDTPVSVWNTKKGGGITGMMEKDYSFYGKPELYNLTLRNEDIDLSVRLQPRSKKLSSPVQRTIKKPFGIKYDIYKHLWYDFEGEILNGQKFEPVDGTAYFQKVTVNAPAIPWYWGVFHTDSGHYIDYMLPHIGPQMLRNKLSHASGPDSFPMFVGPSVEYFDPGTGKWSIFNKVSIRKSYSKKLPIFTLQCRNKSESVSLEATTYSRAHWKFQQNDNTSRTFFYNEYPSFLSKFEYRKGRKITKLKDLGRTWGNCEHSWGRLY